MPRYFFDVTNAGNVAKDTAGVDLVDDAEARDEAIGILPALMRDVMPDGDQHEIVVTARDEAGAVVYEASLVLNGRWWPGRR